MLYSFGDNEKNATSEDDTKADIDNNITIIQNNMILFDSNGNNVITDNKGIESKANYFSETIREYILFYITAKLQIIC